MRGVCAELTLCGGETYAKVSNIGLQIYCVTAAPRRHSTGLSHLAPTTGLRVMAQHLCLSFRPSKPGLRPATESRNPVIKAFVHSRRPWITGSRLARARLSRARLAGTTAP